MIAVRKEDQPKVIALVVILVVVLIFVGRTVFQIVAAKGGSKAPDAPAIQIQAPPPDPAASGLPTAGTVTVNYSELPGPTEANPFREVLSQPGDRPNTSPLPPAGSQSGGSKPITPIGGTLGVGTADGGSKPVIVEIPKKTITLNGIAQGNGITALVTVEQDLAQLSVGQSLGGFRVVTIRNGSVELSTKYARFRLNIGETKKMPTG